MAEEISVGSNEKVAVKNWPLHTQKAAPCKEHVVVYMKFGKYLLLYARA
jgi:hypothetical protein